MPKVNIFKNEEDTRIAAKISEYMVLRNTNVKDIAKGTGIPASTIYRYMKDIGNIQIRNLRIIYNYLKIPRDERII